MDEEQIRRDVYASIPQIYVSEEWYTPSGRPRGAPMYEADIENYYLMKSRTIKGQSGYEVQQKAKEQLIKWAEQEVRARFSEAKKEAQATALDACVDADLAAREMQEQLRGILSATLSVDDRIHWDELIAREKYPPFQWTVHPPKPHPTPPLQLPAKPFWGFLFPSIRANWERDCVAARTDHAAEAERIDAGNRNAHARWEHLYLIAQQAHEEAKALFDAQQDSHNHKILEAQRAFEANEPSAVVDYLDNVFERSVYPEPIRPIHEVGYDPADKTVVVNVELPCLDELPDVVEYKFVVSKNEAKPVRLKKKEHQALFENVAQQIILRTLHEVFEAVYSDGVESACVNGFVTAVNRAIGRSERKCIISVFAKRKVFEDINLAMVDPWECIRGLRGVVAGPLSDIAAVQPIVVFNKEDSRFVAAREIMDGLHEGVNLAALGWEDFEHLVRDLFERMFRDAGGDVRITQSSRDAGVDAVVFDPDPIRGGKFLIQAKRYTRAVPVSAVRDLFGSMTAERASRGILVTTAHFGTDAQDFAKDKPIQLVGGAELVHLMNKHGLKATIDLEAARRIHASTGMAAGHRALH